jgi:Spy/CpxP family protein refolding chaperone
MSNHIKILSTLAAVAVFSVGAVALARPDGHGHGGPHRLMKLVEKLDLTEAQQDLLDEIRLEAMKSRKANRAKKMEAMQALAAEIEKPQVDQTKLQALADQHIELMRQNLHARIQGFAKLHQTLTPAQKKELADQLRRVEKRAKKLHRE